MICWCANSKLVYFGPGYSRCDACQTLVANTSSLRADPRVRDDASDYYGRDYWFKHQTTDLSCPDILSRSRTDLSDRAVHWLRSLLQFKLPAAKVLEVGSGHGGFVAMLRQAGFNADGLELSPSIVKLSRDLFEVDVLTGPIEDQSIPNQSLDAIVMMDVMEHLPDPVQTLGRCINLLKPNGIMLGQTPGYPPGMNLADLQSTGHKFPQMLDPNEHLFLFSTKSVEAIFRRTGAPYIKFIPAIFGFYDISFVVSRQPISQVPIALREAALSSTVSGRMMQAMLDLDDRRLALLEKYRAAIATGITSANGESPGSAIA